jgi:hypothetical protein
LPVCYIGPPANCLECRKARKDAELDVSSSVKLFAMTAPIGR